MINEEAVEAAARAIYECQPLHGFPSGGVISWDELKAGAFAKRGLMLVQARAALEAAGAHIAAEAWAKAGVEATTISLSSPAPTRIGARHERLRRTS